MYTLFTILIVLASVLLILIVLVQNSKGGGLAAGFSSTNQIMGVRKTTDFLEKATWTLVSIVIVLSVATVAVNKKTVAGESEIKEQYQNAQKEEPGVVAPGFGGSAEQPAQQQEDGQK
ncbi:MAG: putative protein-export rane protein [Bacteroidetes bacterium]|jgi:preprotein translocase subunit SecG|nr:putative protein-export rane protein [Bacteroidota bacterium]